MKQARIAILAVLAGLSFSAGIGSAHDDATLDKQPAPHGGQMRMAGPYHLELTLVPGARAAQENPVVVYVTDHAGKEISTAGAKGTATLLTGKQKITVELKPDGGNRLKGVASYDATPATKVAVSVTLPGQPTQQARFAPLAQSDLSGQGMHGHSH